MARQRQTVIEGISEVGAVRSGSDESFGKTVPDGVTISWSGTDREVESGQSTFLEEIFRQADRVEITVSLLYGDLLNMKEALGLPDSVLSGDLQSDTDEILAIAEGELGSREDHLYVISPGPSGTRRYDFYRTKVLANQGNFEVSRDQDLVLEFTSTVLKPSSGDIIQVKDAV